MTEISKDFLNTIRACQTYENDLLFLNPQAEEYAQLTRLQDITTSLRSEYDTLSSLLRSKFERHRAHVLLDVTDPLTGGRKTKANDPRTLLNEESTRVQQTILMVSESLAAARESMVSLTSQKRALGRAGSSVTKMFTTLAQSNQIIQKIRRLKKKHQLILLTVFTILLAFTMIYASHSFL